MLGTASPSVIFRASRRQRLSLCVGLILCTAAFLATPASPIGFGDVPPDRKLLGITFFVTVFGGIALVFLYSLLFNLRHRLAIDESVITATGLFHQKRLNISAIEAAAWKYTTHFRSLVIASDGKRLTIVVDNYSPIDRIRLIKHLHAIIPETRQSGWDLIERIYLRPIDKGANRRGIVLICLACAIGTVCNAAIVIAMKTYYPFWPDSNLRLLLIVLTTTLAFPAMLAVVAVGNWLLRLLTREDA